MVIVLLGEFLLLFLTSRKISIFIFLFFLYITRSKRLSTIFLSILFFPGTFVHEVSHFLMAKVLFVHAGKIEFIPSLDQNGLKLGSVQIAQTDPFRRFLIGVAPLLIGSGIIIFILYYFTQWVSFDTLFYSTKNLIIFSLTLYCIFVITNTMFSSKRDMEGALGLGLFIIFILTVLFVAGRGDWVISIVNQILQNGESQKIIQRIVFLLSFPLTINILFMSIIFLVGKKY